MTARRLDLVFIGLSLSSSWGNGHATTYRALLQGLAARGHEILFLERDKPWYQNHRDLGDPTFCRLAMYDSLADLKERFGERIARSDGVIVGSFVPDGIAILDFVLTAARGTRVFYDIDTPVTLAAIGRGEADYLQARQIREVDLYLSFSGGKVLERLRNDYHAKHVEAFFCAVDDTRYRPLSGPTIWDLGYLGTYSDDRQPTLERLLIEPARRLPDRRFVVAGPQYPETIVWPANVERIDHLAPADHPAFYARQRFTLNVTRADMIASGWCPSVRLFEAAACATPIISDRWNGLSDLLPQNEAILIAESTDEVVHALTEIDESERTELARHARSIVLGAHTGLARAAELERHLAAAADPQQRAAALADEPVPGQPKPINGHIAAAGAGSGYALGVGIRSRVRVPADNRPVLVAGGAGFLGSFLCERLVHEGKRVICLDSLRTGSMANLQALANESRFSFVDGDVCTPLPTGLKVGQIYNLACPASPRQYQADPIHTLMTSVVGTRNLLELAKSQHARLLQASTSEVYGDPDQHPQQESYWGNVNPIGVRACYDEGKRAAETLCFDYPRVHGIDVRVARIFNTYGPRLSPNDGRIVPNLIVQALSGRALTIYGSGEQTRSFCFVTDLVEGLVGLMEVDANPKTPINLGNPEEYTINRLAEIVLALTGSASPIVYEPLPADDPHLRCPDISRAKTVLDWTPAISVQSGLAETIAWFDAQPSSGSNASASPDDQPIRSVAIA